MTASELKYLIAVTELNENESGARMSDVARRLNVSKVSVYKAVERLIESGYIEQKSKRIILTDTGKSVVAEFVPVVDFIGDKLTRHCKTPKEVAFDEAVMAASALGEISRNGVMRFIKQNEAETYEK